MAATLTYDLLKEMKFAEFKKAFKEKTQWKKAEAAVFLLDYKIGPKKLAVAIPLRKITGLKALVKQIKGDKHPNQKLLAGAINMTKTSEGLQVNFSPTLGAYSTEELPSKIAPLFKQLLKYNFSVASKAKPQKEEKAPQEEASPNTSTTAPNNKVDLSKILKSIQQQTLVIKQDIAPKIKQKTILPKDEKTVHQLEQLIQEFEQYFGRVSPPIQQKIKGHKDTIDQKIKPTLSKVKQAITKLLSTPIHDTVEEDEEFKSIEDFEQALQQTKDKISQLFTQLGISL